MLKIADYFYIFSKITTSLVLILIIIIMGYSLLNSYNEVDKADLKLESKIEALKEAINQSNTRLSNLNKKLVNDNKLRNEIKNFINKTNLDKKNNPNTDNINKLFAINKNIQKQIDQILINIKNKNKNDTISNNQFNQVDKIKKIIFSKYINGQDIEKEMTLLENFLPLENRKNFEKINLLTSKKFYGFVNLNKEFDKSINHFVKSTFLKNNQNSTLSFLSKFISIKPSNLSVYENDDLNILMLAKNYLEKEDFEKSLDQVLLLNDNQLFFLDWINQINIYLNFKHELEKVS